MLGYWSVSQHFGYQRGLIEAPNFPRKFEVWIRLCVEKRGSIGAKERTDMTSRRHLDRLPTDLAFTATGYQAQKCSRAYWQDIIGLQITAVNEFNVDVQMLKRTMDGWID
jgi:hypothetical protein